MRAGFVALILVALSGTPSRIVADTTLSRWQASAEAFTRFLDVRARVGWMHEIVVSADGAVETTAPIGDKATLSLWWAGAEWAGISISESRKRPPMWREAVPGRHAAQIKFVTPVGYQSVTPPCWVEITRGEDDTRRLFGEEPTRFKPVNPPADPGDWWPNARLLAWMDWNIAPRRHETRLRARNLRTPSPVTLQVDFHGRVRRSRESDSTAEEALRWRVYHNGELVLRDAATNVTELNTAPHGPGNYTVLAGIDTPAGFFPVSNLLRYSLAPQLNEGLQLAFCQFDYGYVDDYPTWFRRVLPPPFGDGPVVYADAESLAEARAVVAAWEGAAEADNTPDQAWIFRTPDLRDLRPKRERKSREGMLNRFDLDSDEDGDGLTLREEME